MRVNFETHQSAHFSQKLSEVLRKVLLLPTQEKVSLEDLEEIFHKFPPPLQTSRFSNPLWNIISPHLPQLPELKTNGVEAPSIAIIPDFKGGVDVIMQINLDEDTLKVEAIDFEKGGLAANTTESLIKMGYSARFFSIHGKGDIADFHEGLLRGAGINPVRLIDSGRDAYIHPCLLRSSDRQEFWLVQNREAFPRHVIEESTDILKSELGKDSSEALILSATPPSGASSDYFANISRIARANNKPVIFNPKQYDYTKDISLYLFIKGKLDILKPNVIEFVQFLKYTNIYPGDEKDKARELKREMKSKDYEQTIALARQLMKEYNYSVRMMFITFSEEGLIIVTPTNAVHISVPKIKLECSSGAGDSGIAGILAEAHEQKIDLRNDLHPNDLIELGQAFNYAATATASLPGNNIASKDEINKLRSREKVEIRVIQ